MLERITKITERWFLSEEPLFSAFCTHRVAENRDMKCFARVGKGLIEINPDLCEDISDKELEERLRVEVIRILLKHPYDRQPDGCSTTARALGSNCVIADSYYLHQVEMERPQDFELPSNQHFEYYSRRIQQLLPKGEQVQYGEPDEYSDLAANWQQDELMEAQVNEIIRNVKTWGSMSGRLVEEIIASTKARVDYRKILAGFRATILSEKRKLTRMRPNRRFGFDAMGSRYDFCTRMIIGVDCSGSISKNDLRNFYSSMLAEMFMKMWPKAGCPLGTSGNRRVKSGLSTRESAATRPPFSPTAIKPIHSESTPVRPREISKPVLALSNAASMMAGKTL